jgi:tRNA-(ms[2]io[6]A)-hydroxylase
MGDLPIESKESTVAARTDAHRAEAWLASETQSAWAPLAADHLLETLADHAHCEKKAAASALSLINDYPEDSSLVRALGKLAEEEAGHFREVHEQLVARGGALPKDSGDLYAQKLRQLVRKANDDRKLDRLLVGALIEARSCERFRLLREELARRGEAELAGFVRRLESSEAGHAALFVKLARDRFGEAALARLSELRLAEARIVGELPLLPRIH